MGNPAYDARRAAEKADADREAAFAIATRTALEGITDFFNGKASLEIVPGNVGMMVNFIRHKQEG